MPRLTAQEVNQLANNFLVYAQKVGDYKLRNWGTLTQVQRQQLSNFQWSLLNQSEDMFAFSTTLVMNDVAQTIGQLNVISTRLATVLRNIDGVNRAITVVANLVTVGSSILSRNPQAILQSILTFRASLNL